MLSKVENFNSTETIWNETISIHSFCKTSKKVIFFYTYYITSLCILSFPCRSLKFDLEHGSTNEDDTLLDAVHQVPHLLTATSNEKNNYAVTSNEKDHLHSTTNEDETQLDTLPGSVHGIEPLLEHEHDLRRNEFIDNMLESYNKTLSIPERRNEDSSKGWLLSLLPPTRMITSTRSRRFSSRSRCTKFSSVTLQPSTLGRTQSHQWRTDSYHERVLYTLDVFIIYLKSYIL